MAVCSLYASWDVGEAQPGPISDAARPASRLKTGRQAGSGKVSLSQKIQMARGTGYGRENPLITVGCDRLACRNRQFDRYTVRTPPKSIGNTDRIR
jgi:hypothetical protein